jgi:hypothetical protein
MPTQAANISLGERFLPSPQVWDSPSCERVCQQATTHSSNSSCNWATVQIASSATSGPRRVVSRPAYPATCWQNRVLMDRNVRSTMLLSLPV